MICKEYANLPCERFQDTVDPNCSSFDNSFLRYIVTINKINDTSRVTALNTVYFVSRRHKMHNYRLCTSINTRARHRRILIRRRRVQLSMLQTRKSLFPVNHCVAMILRPWIRKTESFFKSMPRCIEAFVEILQLSFKVEPLGAMDQASHKAQRRKAQQRGSEFSSRTALLLINVNERRGK